MMGCSKTKFKGRRVTWFEINSIESLEFICKEDNEYCKVQRFPFKDYIKHMQDHANNNVPQACPLKCNEQLNLQ